MAGTTAALLGAHSALPGRAAAQQEEGLEALNGMRKAAGLTPVRLNPLLSRGAAGHAGYLVRNKMRGHEQQAGRPGFTGRLPTQRARQAGYLAAGVSENLTQGAGTAAGSVEDLMTAIYHRFGFLALDIDEVGIGVGPGDPKGAPWVFNMSDSALSVLCSNPPDAARFQPPGAFTQLCGATSPKLNVSYVETQQARLPRANPAWVIWPPAGYDHTPPAFFEETPNPLPDRKVSGYPISIQFNRAKVQAASLRSFRLLERAGSTDREVTRLRLLNKKTDPNRIFTALDFAWFPLDRLAWDSGYRVLADFDVDGRPQQFEWEFRTRSLGMPVITLGAGDSVLRLPGDVDHALYVPPTEKVPRIEKYTWESQAGMTVVADAIDPNTVRLRLSCADCSLAMMTLTGGRKVKLQVAPKDGSAADACAVGPPDFTIAGKGERLVLQAGRRYRIQVRSGAKAARMEKLSWSLPTTMQIKTELEPPDIVRVQVEGRGCDTAALQLNGGRTFKTVVAGEKCPASPPGRKG